MTAQPKLKAYVSSFVMRLGPIATSGKLVPVRATAPKSSFTMVTPQGGSVKQKYIDEEGKLWNQYELARAIEVDGEQKVLTASDATTVKKSELPSNVANFVVHDAQEVHDKTFPSDKNAYVFIPDDSDPANASFASLFYHIIRDEGKTLLTKANIRNSEGMYRLDLWRDNLIIQRMLYPGEINDHETPESVPENPLADKTAALAEKLTIPFNPSDYEDTAESQLASKLASYGSEISSEDTSNEQAVKSVSDALDSFLGI